MVTNEAKLRERVIRARDAKRPADTGGQLTGGEIVEIKPDMPDAEYAALVARGEQQGWTPEDEEWLRATAARIP